MLFVSAQASRYTHAVCWTACTVVVLCVATLQPMVDGIESRGVRLSRTATLAPWLLVHRATHAVNRTAVQLS